MINLEKTASVPGYDLLGSFEAGVPIYQLRLRTRARKHQQISALPEYVLRMMDFGINTEEQIGKALGLDSEFVQNALEHLNSLQLIKSTINYELTPPIMQFALTARGVEAINRTLLASFDSSMELLIDGLTGRYSAINKDLVLWDGIELKKQGMFLIHGTPKIRPGVENLNKNLSTLITIYRSQQFDFDNTDQLIEILDIPYSRLKYKVVSICVLRNRLDDQLKLKVFEGYESITDYEEKLTERERKGSKIIPDEILVKQTDFIPSDINKVLQIDIPGLEKQQTEIEEIQDEKDRLVEQIQQGDNINPDLSTSKTEKIKELQKQLETLTNQYPSVTIIVRQLLPRI
jgi:hypothetical protein